ncbi:hypothetical protein PR048_022249 [Dryococelus australis]|uniref:Uncharacterized protein n=1 Tax=Dryococelus australis TaxID=614101 RepID=A0ABQ9H0L6_9NEOP|nr:hypothetical protein PR048_022249 [Dryococelus australis]
MDSCEWTGVVENSGISTAAAAEAVVEVKLVTKSRLMHQKTASTLFILLQQAYREEHQNIPYEDWIDRQSNKYPTFKFWLLVLELITLLLSFVRSVREGNYEHLEISLKLMLPWFYVFSYAHYPCWLPIHIKDLEELSNSAPEVHREFCNGNFVIHKTPRQFSALPVDQAHEQNNAIIKGSGGAICLTEVPTSLRRWSLAESDVCRILNEFIPPESEKGDYIPHHEQYRAFQKMFMEEMCALKESFLEYGNPPK